MQETYVIGSYSFFKFVRTSETAMSSFGALNYQPPRRPNSYMTPLEMTRVYQDARNPRYGKPFKYFFQVCPDIGNCHFWGSGLTASHWQKARFFHETSGNDQVYIRMQETYIIVGRWHLRFKLFAIFILKGENVSLGRLRVSTHTER